MESVATGDWDPVGPCLRLCNRLKSPGFFGGGGGGTAGLISRHEKFPKAHSYHTACRGKISPAQNISLHSLVGKTSDGCKSQNYRFHFKVSTPGGSRLEMNPR